MLPIRIQYFCCYATMGCVMPYLAIFLREQKQIELKEIGGLFAVSGVGFMLTPVVITFLADRVIPGRRLISVLFTAHAMALAALVSVEGFVYLLPLFLCLNLSLSPTVPLGDAIAFSYLGRQGRAGGRDTYHKIRFWGSAGFMTPGIVLYFLLDWGMPIRGTLYAGGVTALTGAINAFFLPSTGSGRFVSQHEDDEAAEELRSHSTVPTLDALRAILKPHVLIFCFAMLLTAMASSSYYIFYPVYMNEKLMVGEEWMGLIAGIGVTVELPFVLAFGWILKRFGLKPFMVTGFCFVVLRMSLLWLWPHPTVGVLTQFLHGMMVLTVHIAPPLFLDRFARESFRNSMQGLYMLAVVGLGRLIGVPIAGLLAERDHALVFAGCTAAVGTALLLFVFAFRDPKTDREMAHFH